MAVMHTVCDACLWHGLPGTEGGKCPHCLTGYMRAYTVPKSDALVSWSAKDVARWKIHHRVELARRDAAYRRSQKDNFRGYTHAQPPKPHYILHVKLDCYGWPWWALCKFPDEVTQVATPHSTSEGAIRERARFMGRFNAWA